MHGEPGWSFAHIDWGGGLVMILFVAVVVLAVAALVKYLIGGRR